MTMPMYAGIIFQAVSTVPFLLSYYPLWDRLHSLTSPHPDVRAPSARALVALVTMYSNKHDHTHILLAGRRNGDAAGSRDPRHHLPSGASVVIR